MLKSIYQQQKQSHKEDSRSTQEIVITKPLTALPIFIGNIPKKDCEKSQSLPKKPSH